MTKSEEPWLLQCQCGGVDMRVTVTGRVPSVSDLEDIIEMLTLCRRAYARHEQKKAEAVRAETCDGERSPADAPNVLPAARKHFKGRHSGGR